MKRIHSLFLVFWIVTYVALLNASYKANMKFVTKPQEFDHYAVVMTIPMSVFLYNEDMAAGIIAHELAHIVLHHVDGKPPIDSEYAADVASVYIMEKAGYSPCAMSYMWEAMEKRYLLTQNISHPSSASRAFYMNLPQCRDYKLKKEELHESNVREIFNNLISHLPARYRYQTKLYLALWPQINAFAGKVYKEDLQ